MSLVSGITSRALSTSRPFLHTFAKTNATDLNKTIFKVRLLRDTKPAVFEGLVNKCNNNHHPITKDALRVLKEKDLITSENTIHPIVKEIIASDPELPFR